MTLPTRSDSRIDWEKTEKELLNFDGFDGSLAHKSKMVLMRLASAHTRERCAKWHDGEVATLQKRLDADTETALALILEHKQSAAALRKMED